MYIVHMDMLLQHYYEAHFYHSSSEQGVQECLALYFGVQRAKKERMNIQEVKTKGRSIVLYQRAWHRHGVKRDGDVVTQTTGSQPVCLPVNQ